LDYFPRIRVNLRPFAVENYMTIKIGMVGTGQMAQGFIPLFKAHPLVREVVLCDLDAAKLRANAAEIRHRADLSFARRHPRHGRGRGGNHHAALAARPAGDEVIARREARVFGGAVRRVARGDHGSSCARWTRRAGST
jgi:hypothetical protein